MLAAIPLLALVLLLITPRWVDAACVWVLWSFIGAGQWRPIETFETKARCVEGQRVAYPGLDDDMRMTVSQCLPDTVDPRGPTAARR